MYDLILADPPWRYDFSRSDSRQIENQYPTMTTDEIVALKVGERLANRHCVCYLWATSPKLMEAIIVLGDWGFEYKTNGVWIKDKIGMGYYFRQQHELILVGVKGKPAPPEPSNRPSSVFHGPRTEHSRKPDSVHKALEVMYPEARKLEMFARRTRPGWDVWGNEVPNA